MKTYTHKNGNTYNVNINGESVVLTSDVQGICPLYITLENFKKLTKKEGIDMYGKTVDVSEGSRICFKYKYCPMYGTVTKSLKGKVKVIFDEKYRGVNEATISHSMIYHNI